MSLSSQTRHVTLIQAVQVAMERRATSLADDRIAELAEVFDAQW